MVGGEVRRGCPVPADSDMRAAYDASAATWRSGPAVVYERLADAVLARSPMPLAGSTVLDLGAGTGAACRAAHRAGTACTVAADLSLGMLRLAGAQGVSAVAADALALPFASGSFDAVVACCCLGHLPDPVLALREARRVGRQGSLLLASAFPTGWALPAKVAVEEVLARFGYTPPPWYVAMKRDLEPRVGDATSLRRVAAAAGFAPADVVRLSVDTGLVNPSDLIAWRLGMAHVAPYVASLDEPSRCMLRAAAEAALDGMSPLVVELLVLVARDGEVSTAWS